MPIKRAQVALGSILLLFMGLSTLEAKIMQILTVDNLTMVATNTGYLEVRLRFGEEEVIIGDLENEIKTVESKGVIDFPEDIQIKTGGDRDYYQDEKGYYGVGWQIGENYFFCDNR